MSRLDALIQRPNPLTRARYPGNAAGRYVEGLEMSTLEGRFFYPDMCRRGRIHAKVCCSLHKLTREHLAVSKVRSMGGLQYGPAPTGVFLLWAGFAVWTLVLRWYIRVPDERITLILDSLMRNVRTKLASVSWSISAGQPTGR